MNYIKKGIQSICIVSFMFFFGSCEKETQVDSEPLTQGAFENAEAYPNDQKNSSYWYPINGITNASRITVDPEGNPWVVKTNGDIAVYKNRRVYAIPGKAIDIDAGGYWDWETFFDDTIWITNAANEIFYRSGIEGSWTKIDGLAHTIDVSVDGNPWVINKNNQIYRRINGVNGYWSRQNGAALDIGNGGGETYVIGTNKNLFKMNPDGNYTNLGGIVERVDVDYFERAWVINKAGEIFTTGGDGRFYKLPGAAIDIACNSNGEVYIIGADRRVYRAER